MSDWCTRMSLHGTVASGRPRSSNAPDEWFSNASDERFARRLQEQELEAQRRVLADESLARRLQSEEEAAVVPRHRSGQLSRQPISSAAPGPFEVIVPALGDAMDSLRSGIDAASKTPAPRSLDCFVSRLFAPLDGSDASPSQSTSAGGELAPRSQPASAQQGARTADHEARIELGRQLDHNSRQAAAAIMALAVSLTERSAAASAADDVQPGPARRRGAPRWAGSRTTTITFDGTGQSDELHCTVCVEAFQPGEVLRVLPCLHRYHTECIDRWLRRSSLCPVCKHDVLR
eukprot:gnl/TRDRNA2_/TRDRNA2_189143_c0_seq1.p1 gnl/TRDRNA2_/TRDRNA2_189143_c0~~gnl/TRDRNA2_/TRDRNA2_189143_c0_seq1.p1  ORF type:complete len:290 (-),score=29.46 gnl/TRDRNA2_/TRDRNA2_189143_c0_seq1:2-871(-)